eukprot:3753974-Prymnesium_polylepis.1
MVPREGTKAPGISPCPFSGHVRRTDRAGLNAPLPRAHGPCIRQRCSGGGDLNPPEMRVEGYGVGSG